MTEPSPTSTEPSRSSRSTRTVRRLATIAAKLAAFTGLGLVLLLVQAVASRNFASEIAVQAERLSVTSDAIRAATLADMEHDGLHAGVRLALTSDDATTQTTARAEITEAGAELSAQMQAVKDAGVGAAVNRAVDDQVDDITLYRKLALNVLDTIAAGGDRISAVAALEAQFSKMEQRLPAVADAIDAANSAAQSRLEEAEENSQTMSLVLGGVAILLLSGVSAALGRSLIRPIRRTSNVLHAVADGDLRQRVELNSKDEIGEMATALNAALDNLANTMLAIGTHSTSLSVAAEHLTDVSTHLAATAQQTSTQADVVSTGTSEMSQSIQEISHGAQDAVTVADQAAHVALSTNETVAKLGTSSVEIGNVIKVITSIAEQTNLLALNATIEAARAGEAGKGFAVVAHEVKDLASATTAATADISERIGAIQSDTTEAVRAIAQITEIIGRVGETQSSIASAVEQQTATTTEIGRNISGVALAAEQASSGASDTLDTATDLSRMADELQVLVAGFRV